MESLPKNRIDEIPLKQPEHITSEALKKPLIHPVDDDE